MWTYKHLSHASWLVSTEPLIFQPSVTHCSITREAAFLCTGWLVIRRGDPCWWWATLTHPGIFSYQSTQVDFSTWGRRWRQCHLLSDWKLGLQLGLLRVCHKNFPKLNLPQLMLALVISALDGVWANCPVSLFISPWLHPVVLSFQQILAFYCWLWLFTSELYS